MYSNEQFSVLAEFYDRLNAADYTAYADYLERWFSERGIVAGDLVLDLACGTGSLTMKLADRGYDMIGADLSADMLGVAMERAAESEKSILYIRQDMRSFELYGTVKAVVCALDGVSYLSSEGDIIKCMKLIRNYLEPGGLFIFDVNTPWKLTNLFAGRDYFTEDGDGEVYMGWRNTLRDDGSAVDLHLTIFAREEDGRYFRLEEDQTEYIRARDRLEYCIAESGLRLIAVHKDLFGAPATGEDGEEKWYFVVERP